MKWMSASLLALALLAPAATSALAPDRTKATLEAIRKRLPQVASNWIDKKTSSLLGMVGCQTSIGGVTPPAPRYFHRPPQYFPPSPPFPLPPELASQENAAGVTPDRAKEKLEAIKKKLPEVVKKWYGEDMGVLVDTPDQAELRLVRRTGPSDAKLTIALSSPARGDSLPELLTVNLRYYDGSWTCIRCESRWNDEPAKDNRFAAKVASIRRLMLAIDELAEK